MTVVDEGDEVCVFMGVLLVDGALEFSLTKFFFHIFPLNVNLIERIF